MPIQFGGSITGRGSIAKPGRRVGEPFAGGFGDDGRPFRSQNFSTYNASIRGVTRDGLTGIAIPSVTVQMFRTLDDLFLGQTVSDGSGNYQIYPVPNVGGPYFLVAYLPGSPDIAGTTLNNLTVV